MKNPISCFLFLIFSLVASAQEGNNFDIKYQRCEWDVDPAQTELKGKITYYFAASKDNLQEIVLNLQNNMTVEVVKQRDAAISFSHSDNLVKITLSNSLSLNTIDSISVEYHGYPDNLGFGSYIRSKHNGVPVVWTLSEPYGSEDWFPCKNDLTDKVDSMDIFVTTPDGNKVASNGVLVSVAPAGNGQNTFYWKTRYPVASYLVAFAVTNYAEYSDWLERSNTDKLEILNYVYPEYLETRKTQTSITVPILQFFEEKFGRYPFSDEKYGHAEFGWGGGMEHQTMSFMGGWNYDLIAHELAHQWFGDMITCGSWHDVWLNEGFATYSTALFQEWAYPSQWELWKKNTINNVVAQPGGSVYCYDISGNGTIFNGRLSYNKGGLVLHMLRWVLGDEDFFRSMWNYAHDPDLRYKFAFTADLQRHFEIISGKDLSDFFDTWIYKEGYPSYDITVNQSDIHNVTVTVRQTPSHPSVSCFNMPLPIEFIGEGKSDTVRFDNNQLEQTFTYNPGFEITNVIFDPESWLLCKYQLSNITGIKEAISDKFNISISPNPAKDYVIVKMNTVNNKSIHWTLMDISGRVINLGNTNQNEFIVTTTGISSGIYLLHVKQGASSIVTKLIIDN